MALPEWATLTEREGQVPKIDVDTHVAYPALWAELRALYDERTPPEWRKADGDLKKEWADALEDLESDDPTCYWREVVYQMMKLDLQIATRTVALEIHAQDPGKQYRQCDACRDRKGPCAEGGRGAVHAAGGKPGLLEAREHYKRLRGILPA